jgi:hypothetical protein
VWDRRRASKRLATKQLIPTQTPIPPQTSELTVISAPNVFDDIRHRVISDLYKFKENVW